MNLNNPIEQDIREFEEENKFALPQEFKIHLINFENYKLTNRLIKSEDNGRSNCQIIDSLFPFNATINNPLTVKSCYDQLKDEFKNYIPFGRDPGGAFFIISTNQRNYGNVLFYTMEDDIEMGQIKLAESFDHFTNSLVYASE